MLKIDVLRTERLTVRPFEAADLDAVCALYDGEAPSPAAREARARWLQWTAASPSQLWQLRQVPYGDRAVVQRSDGRLVGAVGLPAILLPPMHEVTADSFWAEAGPTRPAVGLYWHIAEDCRGRGYATEAAGALIAAARDCLDLAEIVAQTTADNAPSQRVMAKLGMTVRHNTSGVPPWLEVLGTRTLHR